MSTSSTPCLDLSVVPVYPPMHRGVCSCTSRRDAGKLVCDVQFPASGLTVCFRVHPAVLSAIEICCHSEAFRSNFIHYITSKARRSMPSSGWSIRLVALLSVEWCNQIVYAWCERARALVGRTVALYESMAWLSTLGGGYSALGDQLTFHSEQAARISVHQLHLAKSMGDKSLEGRCYLYLAISLLQRNELRTAKKLISYSATTPPTVADLDPFKWTGCCRHQVAADRFSTDCVFDAKNLRILGHVEDAM